MRSRLLVVLLLVLLSGCGYRDFQQLDAERQAAWSVLTPLYEQRTALVTNLLTASRALPGMDPVQLDRLAEARAQVASLPATPALPEDATQLQRHMAAQAALSAALSPVVQVARRAPGLLPLSGQFDGLENRLTVARNRYELATQRYNSLVDSFPASLTARVLGLGPRPVLSSNRP